MKNKAKILALLAIGMLFGSALYGQCIPDPACEDTEGPGQFCPMDLPVGAINMEYDETVTVIPPGTFEVLGTVVTILYIQIDSVQNLPSGIDYFPDEDTLYPETAYCIQLTGTPTQIGKDTLAIYISATIDLLGTPTKAQVVDDTSIVITIQETVGIEPFEGSAFQVYPNVPNPFSELTRLDYFVPHGDRVGLKVYNLLGALVHQETEVVPFGKHSFDFNGKGLQPGTYLYRASYGDTTLSGKLVKSR